MDSISIGPWAYAVFTVGMITGTLSLGKIQASLAAKCGAMVLIMVMLIPVRVETRSKIEQIVRIAMTRKSDVVARIEREALALVRKLLRRGGGGEPC